MVCRQVIKQLSAYLHHELTTTDARYISEHLITCPRCEKAFEEIKFGAVLASQSQMVLAPAPAWNEVLRSAQTYLCLGGEVRIERTLYRAQTGERAIS
jgi:anti-sigma factor RsiW